MVPGFDHLPALAAPLAQEWTECARLRRTASVRMAELLLEFRRLGVLPDLSPPTVVEFGVRHGLSPAEARQFADMGLAVEKSPVLAAEARKGDVSLQSAGQLGRLLKVEPAAPLEAWVQTAKTVPAFELKTLVDERIEMVRTGSKSIVSRTLQAPDEKWRKFGRARDVASKRAGEFLSEGQTFGVVVEHYLDSFDPDCVKPRARRMADTRGLPGRNHPAEVKREVLERTGGRCAYPGCTNRIWIQFAHRVPHAAGGCREAWNTYGLCHYHHVRYDRGEIRIEGPIDAPVFYDARGRRIGTNGRVVEHEEHSPP